MRITYVCLQATREGQASYAHVNEIVRGLQRRGHEVTLFEPGYARRRRMPGALGRLLEFARVQARLWSVRGVTDVLYIRHHFATLPAAWLARHLGIPTVHEVNGPDEDYFVAWPQLRYLNWVVTWASRKQLEWAGAVVAVTPGLREWARERTGTENSIFVVPNGADDERFHPAARTDVAVPGRYAVFIGALVAWQGVPTLLAAVRDPRWPRTAKLLVVGDGPDASAVSAVAAVDPMVVYLGRRPYAEVPGILAGAIASLIPKNDVAGHSATGLYPLKLFESMACGVPAVVTDFPGMADLVRREECGLVVAPEDPVALAEAVARLADDDRLRARMGRNGRAAVEREHSWDHRAESTSSILDAVVRGEARELRREGQASSHST